MRKSYLRMAILKEEIVLSTNELNYVDYLTLIFYGSIHPVSNTRTDMYSFSVYVCSYVCVVNETICNCLAS